MNLLVLLENDFIDTTRVRVSGRRLQHVLAVHRASAGDTLRVGVLNGQLGRGRIIGITPEAMELEVALDTSPPPALPVVLLIALPRPKTLKKVLQAATAMGVKRIVLMKTWRVEKNFWDSPVLQPAALQEQMLLGLEQAGDTVLPEILLRRRFKPFVEDELLQMMTGSRALVAHPAAAHTCPRDVRSAVTLAVGPEGGFIPYEIEMLQQRGFEAVSLGPRRLRVEHVVAALLSRLF